MTAWTRVELDLTAEQVAYLRGDAWTGTRMTMLLLAKLERAIPDDEPEAAS